MITQQDAYLHLVAQVDECRNTYDLDYFSKLKETMRDVLKFEHELENIYKKTPDFLPLRNDRARVQLCLKYKKEALAKLKSIKRNKAHDFSITRRVATTQGY